MEVIVIEELQWVRTRVLIQVVDLEVSLFKVKGFKRASG